MMKRMLSLLLALAMLLTAAAALGEESAEPAETVPAAEEPAAEEPAAEEPAAEEPAAEAPAAEEPAAEAPAEPPITSQHILLATVDGTEIYSDDVDLNYWISYYNYYLSSGGYDLSDPNLLAEINQYSMYNSILFALIREKAAELGLDNISDELRSHLEADAHDSWNEILQSYVTAYYPVGEDATEEEIAASRADAQAMLQSASGYTEETYVEELVHSGITSELVSRVRQSMTVSDAEVEARFAELVEDDRNSYGDDISNYEFATQYYGQDSYYIPDGYRGISHILLKVDDELLNTWKDLTSRYAEQQQAAQAASEENSDDEEPVEPAGDEAADEAAGEAEAQEPEPTAEPVEPVTQEMIDAAEQAILDSLKETLDEIASKYESGASFESLIAEYGTDPGMLSTDAQSEYSGGTPLKELFEKYGEGMLGESAIKGYMIHPESLMYDANFVKGAMSIDKVGDLSSPVVSQFGVHILKYLRDIPGGAVDLTDELREELHTALMQEKFNVALDEWYAQANIVYTAEGEPWKLPDEALEEAEPAE